MAGGTGGHVIPGLSVAAYLRDQGVEVHWLGTTQGLESQLVPPAGFPLHYVAIYGLRGKGFKRLLTAPLKISSAVRQSQSIIQKINPDIVLGMGGFVSGPGGIASWLMRRPLIVHEQNAKAGMTNKILAYFANKVLEGFPTSFKPQTKVVTVGNPVRVEIENLPSPEARFDITRSPFRLLILGGSLGAQALNEMVPRAIARLPETLRPEIWHQTGTKNFDKAKKVYASLNISAHLSPFIEDMGSAYGWADLVICRAGALTVAELCAVGLGAIFVPFPYAVDDHQTANANFMVKKGAALCIQQSALTEEKLAKVLSEFAKSPEKRLAMACAAYQLRKVKVSKKIFDILSEVMNVSRN